MMATTAARATEKRLHPRYKCEGNVEFQTEGVDMRTQGTITDISLSGCYVETPATSAVNTPVNMLLNVKGISLAGKGVVRTSFPLLGMGIEFSEIDDRNGAGLEALIKRLAGEDHSPPTVSATTSSVGTVPHLMIIDSGAALTALSKFFQRHQEMTREQFIDVIGNQTYDEGERS